MWKKLSCLLSLALFAVLSGCGGGGSDGLPSLVPVSGTVTLDGKPLQDAEINFNTLGETEGPGSLAISDSNGKFIVRTSDNEGAAVGEYKVTVIQYGGEDGKPLTSDEMASEFPPAMFNILPKQYEDVALTPLKVTIGKDGNESIKLELVSTGAIPAAGAE